MPSQDTGLLDTYWRRMPPLNLAIQKWQVSLNMIDLPTSFEAVGHVISIAVGAMVGACPFKTKLARFRGKEVKVRKFVMHCDAVLLLWFCASVGPHCPIHQMKLAIVTASSQSTLVGKH